MSQPSLEAFLQQLEIFSELEEEEIRALARIVDEYEFDDKATIAYQRDVANKMIIVRSGRLFAYQVDSQGIVRDTRSYFTGDYFEDTWLFAPQTHQATVKGAGEGRILMIEEEKFLRFLDDHPYLVEYLHLSEEAQQAAEGSRFAQPSRRVRSLNLLPDEIVQYNSRRSFWLYVVKVFWLPLVWLGFVAIVWGFLGLRGTWVIGATVLLTIILGVLALVRFIDWSNDFFIITNKHLIHREYSLRRFRGTVIRTPIDQVQSVEILKPSLLANTLNVGAARVTTAAQAGVIMFDYIHNPEIVEQIISLNREQVQAVDAGRAQMTMRSSVEEHFEASPAYRKVEEPRPEEEEEEALPPLSRIGTILGFLSRGVSSRVVEGNTITYRKHFFTLLGRIWLPVLLGGIFFTVMILIESLTVALIFLVLFLLDLAWFIWRFEDWRNDTFQLNDRYVIDIDRRPFGFGESRTQAELSNVQNVNADKPGLLATIFNFGFVYIETAGAAADITFEKVVNPNLIQSDIFRRREEFRQRQRVREGEQRRKEYAVLLDVYQQAQEQDRIPNRTPTEYPDYDALEN